MKHTWLLVTLAPFAVYADMAEEQTEQKKLDSYENLAKQSLQKRAAELSLLLQDEEKKEVAVTEEAAPVEEEKNKEIAQETAEIQMTGQKRSLLHSQKKEARTTAPQREKQEEQPLKPAHEALTPKRKETKQAAAATEKPAE